MFKIRRASTINAEITVPGDKSISHRALMLSALSNGTCRISGLLEGEDCLNTLSCLRQLGVQIEKDETNGDLVITGCKGEFTAPSEDLYCGNSGTTMRILSGILASQPFTCRLTGDPSLSKRPMRRIMEPLRLMGAGLFAEGDKDCPPLRIQGGKLSGIRYETPVASAQVKSAILLAGLRADGNTTVIEPALSRDHTERMLDYHQVRTVREDHGITIYGHQIPESRDFRVPGDISSAAFWMVAAAAQPGARLIIERVGLNPTRTGIIDVLIRMGARIREIVSDPDDGEPSGTLEIHGGTLQGTEIAGEEIPNVIDEIPILAIAGALAEGSTTIRDARELRVKETDRIAAICANLRVMGASVEERDDGFTIHGPAPLHGARLPSFGDHRIAMSFAIAGLFAKGETIIEDADCANTSYPGFGELLHAIQRGEVLRRSSLPLPEETK